MSKRETPIETIMNSKYYRLLSEELEALDPDFKAKFLNGVEEKQFLIDRTSFAASTYENQFRTTASQEIAENEAMTVLYDGLEETP
ncbi:MAG: DUF1896 family protein [Marinoscillum sp.]